MKRIQFSRSILVGLERPEKDRVLLHGVLEDNIYGMEIHMEITRPDYVIRAVSGRMNRYTTSECPKATEALETVLGIKLDEPDLASQINKKIGRAGCRHFAELILECIDTLMASEPISAWKEARDSGLEAAGAEFVTGWVQGRSLFKNRCLGLSDRVET